jgi:hypothetical protein
MATLRQLEGRLERVTRRLERGFSRVLQQVGNSVGEELVPATPVDTGFARANWRPALNSPAVVPVSALDPSGAATIAKIKSVSNRARVGDTIFIVNNAPYISQLNAGSSPQASPRFVQEAVRKGTKIGIASFRGGRLL